MDAVVALVFLLLLTYCLGATGLLPLFPVWYLRVKAQAEWIRGWRKLLRQAPCTFGPHGPLGVVCVTGRAAVVQDTIALESPIHRRRCVAYWIHARGGTLSVPKYWESQAVPFSIDHNGQRVIVDPSSTKVHTVHRQSAWPGAPVLSVEQQLAGRLRGAGIRWSVAAPPMATEERIEELSTCTVLGELVTSKASPYRDRDEPILGGGSTLLLAAMSPQELDKELRRQHRACLTTMAALGFTTAVGGFLALALVLGGLGTCILWGGLFWALAFLCLGRFARKLFAMPGWPVPPPRPDRRTPAAPIQTLST